MFAMRTAPKNGQKIILLVGDNEWSTIGYFDDKLGWVAEKRRGHPEAGVVPVKPKGWEPFRSAA